MLHFYEKNEKFTRCPENYGKYKEDAEVCPVSHVGLDNGDGVRAGDKQRQDDGSKETRSELIRMMPISA